MAQHYLTYLGRKRLQQLALISIAVLAILLTPSSTQRAPVSETIGHILSYRINTPVELEVAGRKLSQLKLRQLYARHDYRPIWVNDSGPNLNATSFRRCLKNSAREGLNPNDYRLTELEKYWKSRTPEHLTRLELLLTDIYFEYASHMHGGRVVPQAVDKDWFLTREEIDPVDLLQKADMDEVLCHTIFQLRPQHPQYQRLRSKLALYREIEASGGWPFIAQGELIKPGMEHEQVPLIRKRLSISGDYENGESDSLVFDEPLSEAVKRFQIRHGIYTDGMVGNETREAMSIPVVKRIAQIIVNLERWRWVPRKLGFRYIVVNAAGYELEVVEDEQPVLDMRVVVGKRERPTPVFNSDLMFVDMNPIWNVPRTIAVEDILPRLKRDPGYAQKQGIEVLRGWGENEKKVNPYQIDWSWYNEKHLPFHFRQPPGPDNPLGRVRFLFPNSHDIYLHDTNHQELFANPERNFSSGCIRVQRPLTLARYLLKDDTTWTLDKIVRQINTGDYRRVQLGRTLPVYILYMTAWVDEDGAISFYKDAYGRDRELLYELGIPTY
ncbi:MAG: L,D-transpeptidase family protein [Gammaproteobacteria bacterium]|nr:L,D-transpeptidase family protein [Gammaproteobacteria bacterium]